MKERAAPYVLAAQARSPDIVHMICAAGSADMMKEARWLRFPLS